jgi:predicted Zn-dependent protease
MCTWHNRIMTCRRSGSLLAAALRRCTRCACAFILLSHSLLISAQSAGPAALVADIPDQPVAQALEEFSRQTALQVVYLSDVIGKRRAQRAPAGLAPADALACLLRGTGLNFDFLNARMVRIGTTLPPPVAPPPELQEVVVTAAAIRNRPQVAAPSPQELHTIEAANEELERRIARGGLLYGNAALDEYLQGVADRLLGSDTTDASAVHIRVIRGASATAFSLSDGSIYITTAVLASFDNESELAALLGRELTHYTNAHVLRALRDEHRRVVSERIALTLIGGIDIAPFPTGTTGILQRAFGGYSSDLEREADEGGVRRMVAAGYDASGALAGLQRLQGPAGVSAELPVYASHPKLVQRMASCRELLAGKLGRTVAAGGETRAVEYQRQLGELPLDQVAILVDYEKFEQAEKALEVVVATGDSGRAEYLRGEISRKRVPQTDATVERALAAYGVAIMLPDAPAATYRELGLLRRLRGETADAVFALQTYLERAPLATDAPLILRYLEEARRSAASPGNGGDR